MKTLMKENCTTEKQNTNTVRIHKQDRSLRMMLGQAANYGPGNGRMASFTPNSGVWC